MKLSLALIVKASDEEAKKLDTCLSSSARFFDEIVITITGNNQACEDVANKYNAKISHFTWVNDFAQARNYNFSQATGDWVMWLDADDILRGGENIRKNVELADQHNVTGLNLRYNYSHDSEGQVKDFHDKLQIVKNGYYEWRGVLHENLMAIKPTKEAGIRDVVRVHTATEKDSENSLRRNLEILLEAVKKEPEEPRHYFYMARCYLGVEGWNETIQVLEKYLTLSNWKEERYEALNMMGEAYMRLGEYDESIRIHTLATTELEDAPDAYIYKARNYVQKEEWLNALTCLQIAEMRDKDNVILKRTALYDHDLYLLSALCMTHLGEFANAKAAAERAYRNRKTNEAKEMVELTTQMFNDEQITLKYRSLGENLLDQPEKLRSLIDSMPDEIRHDPRILALTFNVEQKVWPEGSVAIYCGASTEDWDGNSVKNGGIGGSETAVIEIAKRLVKEGKQVTVYNQCGAPQEGMVIDGVEYKNHWQINKLDKFDILWLWRSPDPVDEGFTANKIIVDMHDVSTDAVFTPERLAKIDHVFVKTEYHKTLYPSIPDEKFVVVGNGIDLDRFKEKIVKNPNMFIYTSTQNRGLENILDVWPKIKAIVPEAELHIFYGWNTFVLMNSHKPQMMEWMRQMEEKMQQPGIINHGRVNQVELAKYQQQATYWLYPTEFQEIHCITALEMQAAKVYPITTGFAALAETQASGVKIPGDPKTDEWREKFLHEIEFAHENPDVLKKDIVKGLEYVKECTWDKVTAKWIETLWNTQQ